MKWFRILTLSVSVWLVGCAAGLGTSTTGDLDSTDSTFSTLGTADSANTTSGEIMPPVPVTELQSARVAALSTPTDIWDRIRRGFAMPDLDDEYVRKHEQWYSKRPEYIERMVERSRMYIFHVVEELELRSMPTELALLPFIESAFNPQAVSSAKAAGLWQFMPSTGRDFSLKQNILRDDRRDVVNSTRAALDYLQMLHDMFNDWHLALAAYNWGQGNVQRAIERNHAANLGTSYLDLKMPIETRNYVPKLQAVKNIIANPQAYGTVLPLIENHPFFDTVEITQDIDLDVAARLAQVSAEDFKALNPSQRKPVIFAAGTELILLPWNNAAIFKKNLAAAAPNSLASWTAWVAPSTLPSREVAKRFGMTENELRSINNLPKRVLIKAGSTVLVRRPHGASTAVADSVVDNAHLSYAPEVVLRRTTVRAHRGDTIATVAVRYDLPAATVARWNKTSTRSQLAKGRRVVLYLPVRAAALTKSHATRVPKKALSSKTRGVARKSASNMNRSTLKATKSRGKTSAKVRPEVKAIAKRAPKTHPMVNRKAK